MLKARNFSLSFLWMRLLDETVSDTGSNTDLAIRWQYRKTGGVVDLEGLLYVDICQQNRFLLNGFQINR